MKIEFKDAADVAQTANEQYWQWMPTRWIELFVAEWNRRAVADLNRQARDREEAEPQDKENGK